MEVSFLKLPSAMRSDLEMLLRGGLAWFRMLTQSARRAAATSDPAPIYLQAVSMLVMKSEMGMVCWGYREI